jgi:hypothetical protein
LDSTAGPLVFDQLYKFPFGASIHQFDAKTSFGRTPYTDHEFFDKVRAWRLTKLKIPATSRLGASTTELGKYLRETNALL